MHIVHHVHLTGHRHAGIAYLASNYMGVSHAFWLTSGPAGGRTRESVTTSQRYKPRFWAACLEKPWQKTSTVTTSPCHSGEPAGSYRGRLPAAKIGVRSG